MRSHQEGEELTSSGMEGPARGCAGSTGSSGPRTPWGLQPGTWQWAQGCGLRLRLWPGVTNSYGQESKRDLDGQCVFPDRLPKNPILPRRENTFMDSDVSSSCSS